MLTKLSLLVSSLILATACGGLADSGPSLGAGKGDMVNESTRWVYPSGKETIHVGNSSSPSAMFILTITPATSIQADLFAGAGLGWVNTVTSETALSGAICNGAHTTLELTNPTDEAVEVGVEQVELDCSAAQHPEGEQAEYCRGVARALGVEEGFDPCATSSGKQIRLLTLAGTNVVPAETRPYERCGVGASPCGRGCQYTLSCDDL